MAQPNSDLLRGTLDMLVLKVLQTAPQHGYGIGRQIQEVTQDVLSIEQGSLYPALYRLEKAGLLKSHWGTSGESKRRVRIYRITAAGRRRLKDDVTNWTTFVTAVSRLVVTK